MSERDERARDRDRAAELRDRGAEDRDAQARQHEAAAAAPGPVDRDRQLAARDRKDAAEDRGKAADDRDAAAGERAAAHRDHVQSSLAVQRAAETFDSISDAFLTLDADWRLVYLNRRTEPFLGGRRREDLVGRVLWQVFPELVGTRFDDECRRAVRDRVPVRFDAPYASVGRTLTLEVRAHPVTGGLAVYAVDVTDERLRDHRLARSEQLETLGRLTAGISHDFNNFLAVIGGFATLGQAAAGDEKTAGYFDEISSASQKAQALTGQLVTFGRGVPQPPSVIDLNQAVTGLASFLHNLVPAGVELRIALSPDPVAVCADPTQLEQVLVNLIVNSRDAMDATGTITVRTASHALAAAAEDVPFPAGWLQVADTGCGIADEVRPHIFDPFFSTKPADRGTGLGLATIQGIVTRSGGVIIVDSVVDVSTTVTVAFPATPPPVSPT